MNLLHLIRHGLESEIRRQTIIRELSWLDDRTLADIGIARDGIRHVARLASREPDALPGNSGWRPSRPAEALQPLGLRPAGSLR